jgi:hypothetical protein
MEYFTSKSLHLNILPDQRQIETCNLLIADISPYRSAMFLNQIYSKPPKRLFPRKPESESRNPEADFPLH